MKHFETYEVNELVDLIKSGDARAFGELYDRYVKTVFNKCLSFTRDRDQAEDIAQEVFIKVYQKLPEFNNNNFGGWLMRVTYNQCIDFSRKSSKINDNASAEEIVQMEDPTEDVEKQMMGIKLDALAEILTQLDPTDRTILILKYQEEKRIKELAQLLEIGESAVKMRLSRARLQVIDLYNKTYGQQ